MEGNRGKLKTFSMDAIYQLKTDYQTIRYICYLSEQQRRKRKFMKLFRLFDKEMDREFDVTPSYPGEMPDPDESGFGEITKSYPETRETDDTILNRIVSENFSDPMAAFTPLPNAAYMAQRKTHG